MEEKKKKDKQQKKNQSQGKTLVPVQQIAADLGVTTQTVRNEMKRQSISAKKKENEKEHFVFADEVKPIKTAIEERKNGKQSAKFTAKNAKNNDLVLSLQKENEELRAMLQKAMDENQTLLASVSSLSESLRDAQRVQKQVLRITDSTTPEHIEADPDLREKQLRQDGKGIFWKLFGFMKK